MIKIKLAFLISILLIMISCSKDDNSPQEDDMGNIPPTLKLYKKSTAYVNDVIDFKKEVTYNENDKIQSILSTETNFNVENLVFNYTNNQVTSIEQNIEYTFNNTFFSQTYDVTYQQGKITLVASDQDITIEIDHSNGYVNSTRSIITSSATIVFENNFTRNSDDNIISISESNIVYSYSNFDTDKQNDPFGATMTYEYSDFFKVFNLKASKANPKTVNYGQGGNSGSENITMEYDSNNYVTRKDYVGNSSTIYVIHEYIDQ